MAADQDSGARHHVSRSVAALLDDVRDLAETPLWSLSPADTADALKTLSQLTSAVASLEARVAQHASVVQVEDLNGATSTATWWAHATRQTRAEAFRKVHLAAG
ncbi:MAG: hypothetical protein ACXVW1_05630, partial [Nocardioides sp.]